MNNPLPPLGLDDIRAAGPDRDSAEAFDPEATWDAACDAILRGYSVDDVAGVLLELDDEEFSDLTMERMDARVDAGTTDMALHRALAVLHSDAWVPTLSTASVYDLVDERDRLSAQLAAIPAEAIGSALKWAEAFHEQGRDDEMSAEERAERDQGEEALGAVLAWLGTLKG